MLSSSVMSNSVTPWTAACQAPLSMGILQARILEWVAMPSSRGIFPTQGLNPGLLQCRWILYHLSYRGATGVSSLSLLQRMFLTQEWNQGFKFYTHSITCSLITGWDGGACGSHCLEESNSLLLRWLVVMLWMYGQILTIYINSF